MLKCLEKILSTRVAVHAKPMWVAARCERILPAYHYGNSCLNLLPGEPCEPALNTRLR